MNGNSWTQITQVYFDRRMIKIFLLGIISGFPWVLIGSSLSLWLKEEGLSRSTIGWAGLIFGVYAINFLWAPLIDRLRLPLLTNLIGHRRSWIILSQLLILISLLLWSFLNPSEQLWLVIGIGLIIAIASATQDITIDALRIEQIEQHETLSMAAGAAIAVVGWWTGYKVGGIVALFTADYFQDAGFANYWQISFILLCLIIVLSSLGLLFVQEKITNERLDAQHKNDDAVKNNLRFFGSLATPISWILGTVVGPLLSFFRKNGYTIGIYIISFIFLFKIGEAFLGRMSIVFYKEIGFSKSDIALYSKGIGWITTVCFTIIGGVFAIRAGVIRALIISGVAMAATNLLFSLLAWVGKSELLFALAVLLDDLATAFATVAFVAFISLLVDRTYTATQYALMASIGTAGRTLLASSSGTMVDWLDGDWGTFFVITAIMVIPSLAILLMIKNKLNLEKS